MMCLSTRVRERERCKSAKERGKGKVTEEEAEGSWHPPPQGARQPSSGWALWYILPIFHAHPSWCDPTQGLLYQWQLCAGKHAAALIAWNREQRPPRRGEGGHRGTLCSGPAWLWTQTDVRTAPALTIPWKRRPCRRNVPEMHCFGPPLRQKLEPLLLKGPGNMFATDKSQGRVRERAMNSQCGP